MANPTSNFGWQMPQNTDLVKDLPADFEVFGQAVDTSLMDLKGGTTGQVLSKASNTDMDFTWVAQDDSNAIQNAIVDAKGDLISATAADTPARLAVGTNGQVLTADSTTATGLKWSTPATATSWTNRQAGTGSGYYEIAYNGSNLYVAVGSAGQLYTSADGLTWTSRTSGFGANNIYGVGYGNGLFVAVGQNGTMTTSTDGITWTARTANMSTNQIYAVTYANSLWVAVGAGGGTTNTGGITYSTDGLTWTRKSQSLTVGADYYDVTWNGTNWIVGANTSTNNHLYASTPSGTWTAGSTGARDVYFIHWDGTRHLTLESGTPSPYYSTSLTLGTTTAYVSTHQGEYTNAGAHSYYNGKLYVTSSRYWGTLTPATSTTVVTDGAQQLPVIVRGTTPFINGSQMAFFAGAAGLIYASSFGIYTSF